MVSPAMADRIEPWFSGALTKRNVYRVTGDRLPAVAGFFHRSGESRHQGVFYVNAEAENGGFFRRESGRRPPRPVKMRKNDVLS